MAPLILIGGGRARLVRIADVPAKPVMGWVIQQARNLCMELSEQASTVTFLTLPMGWGYPGTARPARSSWIHDSTGITRINYGHLVG